MSFANLLFLIGPSEVYYRFRSTVGRSGQERAPDWSIHPFSFRDLYINTYPYNIPICSKIVMEDMKIQENINSSLLASHEYEAVPPSHTIDSGIDYCMMHVH